MSERYFAFGANVHPATLARRGVTPALAVPARLDGHRLVFDAPGIPLLEPAFASVREADDAVWGVLYELSASDLARLRSFEGSSYLEVGVDVECEGERVRARAFVTAGDHRERRPSKRYLAVIAEGARLRRLPASWVARLEAHPHLYVPVVHEVWRVSFHLVDRAHRLLVSPSRRQE